MHAKENLEEGEELIGLLVSGTKKILRRLRGNFFSLVPQQTNAKSGMFLPSQVTKT